MIIKTEEERAILREGGTRLGKVLQALKGLVAPGISTQFLEEEAHRLIHELGDGDTPAFFGYRPEGAPRSFPAAVCVSVNETIVHGVPNEEPYEFLEGDIVTLDVGLVHKGLITDAAISTIAGRGSKEDEKLIRATEESLAAAIKTAKVGNTTGDLGAAIETVITKYGFQVPHELGGHGVGRTVHEEPFIPNWRMPQANAKLQKDMVIAIEPMCTVGSAEMRLSDDDFSYYTRDGSKTAHTEHTVIVGETGAEVLTSA